MVSPSAFLVLLSIFPCCSFFNFALYLPFLFLPPNPGKFAGSFLAATKLLWCRSHTLIWVCIPGILLSGLFCTPSHASVEWKVDTFIEALLECRVHIWVFLILANNISLAAAIPVFMCLWLLHCCFILFQLNFNEMLLLSYSLWWMLLIQDYWCLLLCAM